MLQIVLIAISIISLISAVIAIVLSITFKNSVKATVTSRVDGLKDDNSRFISEFHALEIKFGQLEYEKYTKLHKSLVEIRSDITRIDTGTKDLQVSMQAHFSKWAKKLGMLKKETEVTPTDTEQLPEKSNLLKYPEFAQEPPPAVEKPFLRQPFGK